MIAHVILHHNLHHENIDGLNNEIKLYIFNVLQSFLNTICVSTTLLEGRVAQAVLVQVQSRAPFKNTS